MAEGTWDTLGVEEAEAAAGNIHNRIRSLGSKCQSNSMEARGSNWACRRVPSCTVAPHRIHHRSSPDTDRVAIAGHCQGSSGHSIRHSSFESAGLHTQHKATGPHNDTWDWAGERMTHAVCTLPGGCTSFWTVRGSLVRCTGRHRSCADDGGNGDRKSRFGRIWAELRSNKSRPSFRPARKLRRPWHWSTGGRY